MPDLDLFTRCEAGVSECERDSAVYALEIDGRSHYYCAYHAQKAGIPVAPGAIGVRAYGFRLADRSADFAFAPTAELGRRFAPVGRQGSHEGEPDAEAVPEPEGREGASEAKRGAMASGRGA